MANAPTITNIDEIIESVNIVERTSKAGNQYKMVQLVFNSGYEMEFLTRERAEIALIEQELHYHGLTKQ
jgi:hypothetical protein